VILIGSDYWSGLLDWIRGTLLEESAIHAADAELLRVTDDPAEACRIIDAYVTERRGAADRTADATKPIDAAAVSEPTSSDETES
jgi:hypothetical protein